MSDFLLDSKSGDPSWTTADVSTSPKAAFALEAAKRLKRGSLTLDHLERLIVAAANAQLAKRGSVKIVDTLKQVQIEVSGTAYSWFHELKRVCSNDKALNQLIAQSGTGLTALYRRLGPHQHQRPKGIARPKPSSILKPLKSIIADLESTLDNTNDQIHIDDTREVIKTATVLLRAAHQREIERANR